MTLYDITLEREALESEDGFPGHYGPGTRFTVRITPFEMQEVAHGSTLVLNDEDGPRAVLTGPRVHLVIRGEGHFHCSRFLDDRTLLEYPKDAPVLLAHIGESLIIDGLRQVARDEVFKLLDEKTGHRDETR